MQFGREGLDFAIWKESVSSCTLPRKEKTARARIFLKQKAIDCYKYIYVCEMCTNKTVIKCENFILKM